MTEDQIQAKFYKEAYNTFPQIRGLLFSVPNGGSRNRIEALKFQATGLTPGIPDMLLVAPQVAAFEFKTETGQLSPAQLRIHIIWKNAGIPVYVCRSCDEAMGVLRKILLP